MQNNESIYSVARVKGTEEIVLLERDEQHICD